MYFKFYLTACVVMQYEFKVLITLCSRQKILYLAYIEVFISDNMLVASSVASYNIQMLIVFNTAYQEQ